MYSAPPLDTPVPPIALTLAAAARNGELVVCVGAGVSMAMDADLPSGEGLAEKLHERLGRLAGYVAPENIRDLIAVADAAVAPAGGEEALRLEVLELARFERATPNHGHQVLGLLLAEGALTLLTWNWDNCIERSAPEEEQLRVAKTHAEMQDLLRPQMAKVHGCATMPPTLLITSTHLSSPPVWAEQAFRQRLHGSKMVFIGIGDVADYVQRRISELLNEFGTPDVRVVSTSIKTKWDESVWASVMPGLEEERRIEQTADEFLEELARAWAGELLQGVGAACESVRDEVEPGVRRVIDAFNRLSAIEVIRWCRRAVMQPDTGESAVLSSGAADALIAAGVLAARDAAPVTASRAACYAIGDEVVEVLIARERMPASDIQREGLRRAEQLAERDQLGDEDASFLVVGTVMGRLDGSAAATKDMVSGDGDTEDVVDGPRARKATYITATELLMEAT